MQDNRRLTQLSVSDVEKSVHFYTHYLGFEKVADVNDFGYAILEKEDMQLLISNPVSQGIIARQPTMPLGRGIQIEFKFKDILSIYLRLKDTGIKIDPDLDLIGFSGFRMLKVHAPEDYILRLIRADSDIDIKEENLAQNSLNVQMMFRINSSLFLNA